MKERGLDASFLKAMRDGLKHGSQNGYNAWENHWENSSVYYAGAYSPLMPKLLTECVGLVIALSRDDSIKIRRKAANIANYAMMIADVHKKR